MNDNNKQYILAGVDASERASAVTDYAIWLSHQLQNPLYLLHTIEHSHIAEQVHREGNLTPNIRRTLLNELSDGEHQQSKKLIAEGKLILDKASTKAKAAGVVDFLAKQRHGTLSEALSDLEQQTRMVVIGSKGEGHGSEKGLGSQLELAIRAIQRPLFIVNTAYTKPQKLMFAFNGSPTSTKILEMFRDGLICNNEVEVHVVCVQKELAEAEKLTSQVIQFLTDIDNHLVTQALAGDPLEHLIQYQIQHNIDITAMGAFSHSKMHGFFFGSFTTKMLLQSNTNFILIRQDVT